MGFRIQCVLMATALCALGARGAVASAAAPESTPAPPIIEKEVILKPKQSIDPRGAYTAWRWVGIRKQGSSECPQVDGWSAEPLVVDPLRRGRQIPDRAAADAALLRGLGLDRFCVYTAAHAQPFPKLAGLTAAPDRLALSANGDLDDRVAPVLAAKLIDQAGGMHLSWNSGGLQQAAGVRLAFLDSQPPGNATGGSRHGATLAHLAQNLVGGAAEVTTRRALGYSGPGTGEQPPPLAGEQEGGHVGLVGDLATAIVDEILDWRQTGSPGHLILNLSVGWDGELFGDLRAHRIEDLDPAVQAVYNALRFAAKRNVLVIAAAGNRRGGPQESAWPLLPAAWELRRPGGCPLGFGRKLVYAVGGVDWQGVPLPNSRRGAMPRRVAYGDHGTAASPGVPATAVYTGTSVSTAVVSSAAAVAWDLRPGLRPAQLMRLISRSGERLDTKAEFYPWRDVWPFSWLPRPRLQRVSVCAAVRKVCGPGAALCPALAAAPQCPLWDRQPPQLSALFPDTLKAKVVSSSPFSPTGVPSALIPPCDPRMQLMTTDGHVPAAPCPTDQLSSAASQRWVMPQPEDNPCPNCSLLPKPPLEAALAPTSTTPQYYALKLAIDPATWSWTGATYRSTSGAILHSATLDIDRFERGRFIRRMTYPIPLDSGEVASLGDGQSLRGCRAQINFVVLAADGTTMSFQNPVVVDP